MTQANSVHSTPPTNAPTFPPRVPTSQERGDELLQRWRLERAVMTGNRELDPRDVLADLLGSGDFPAEVLDPEGAARIILERLNDAGFKIVPTTREGAAMTIERPMCPPVGPTRRRFLSGAVGVAACQSACKFDPRIASSEDVTFA